MTDTIKPVTTDEAGEPTLVPQPKILTAGVAGAITVVVVFAVQAVWPDFEIPDPVAVALTTIITFAAGYFKRPSGIN
jgi:hypothetical protein